MHWGSQLQLHLLSLTALRDFSSYRQSGCCLGSEARTAFLQRTPKWERTQLPAWISHFIEETVSPGGILNVVPSSFWLENHGERSPLILPAAHMYSLSYGPTDRHSLNFQFCNIDCDNLGTRQLFLVFWGDNVRLLPLYHFGDLTLPWPIFF